MRCFQRQENIPYKKYVAIPDWKKWNWDSLATSQVFFWRSNSLQATLMVCYDAPSMLIQGCVWSCFTTITLVLSLFSTALNNFHRTSSMTFIRLAVVGRLVFTFGALRVSSDSLLWNKYKSLPWNKWNLYLLFCIRLCFFVRRNQGWQIYTFGNSFVIFTSLHRWYPWNVISDKKVVEK